MKTRREMLKLGLAGAAAVSLGRGRVRAELPPGPSTTPFVEPLPIPPLAQPVSYMDPMPPRGPYPFQRYDEFAPRKLYEIHVRTAGHSFHPELPLNNIWGYNGIFPGPTFVGQYGEPVLVRFYNELPPRDQYTGPGSPEITTHLHAGHTGSESDGFPEDYFPKQPQDTDPGDMPWPYRYKDNHYPNVDDGADPREACGTLWYHDHRHGFTAANVYKGLAGFYLLFDDIDSGNELDSNPQALRLPSGAFDIPMIFADKAFDSTGQVFFDQFNLDGILGDKFTVNGKIQPYLRVARRKYRFRLLDGGPARFYEFCLRKGRWNETSRQVGDLQGLERFFQISNDGNLLPAPLDVDHVRLSAAERADVIIDFSEYQVGDQLFFFNRLEQTDGRGPSDNLLDPGTPVLRFDVDRDEPDYSRIPDKLRDLPPIELTGNLPTRRWEFNRSQGAWQINGQFFENKPAATAKQNTAEIWILKNGGGGWSHPIHIHLAEFRILRRNGRPIMPGSPEFSRKDVVVLGPDDEVEIFMQFRNFLGKYVLHCHNTVHEDHAMMLRWDVVP